MARWIRFHDSERDAWSYVELDEQLWALRQVELRGIDHRPVTAASLAEVLDLRDHADLAAMTKYERRYGVLAEAGFDGWEQAEHASEIAADVFERAWADARRTLDAHGGDSAQQAD